MMNYRIGIDLGGTAIKAGLVDENYNIIQRATCPTSMVFEESVERMAALAEEVAAKQGLSIRNFTMVGVGAPSFIHPETGNLVFLNNTNWRNVPLRGRLQERLNVPVRVLNDADCAIIGEALAGAAKGAKNVLMLTLGTGVGGGLIMNGKRFSGADGMGVELGHVPLIAGGEHCNCGIDGCLESYASVTALIRDTKKMMQLHPNSMMHSYAKEQEAGKVTGRTAFECAKHGDAAAIEVVETYVDYLARGIGGFVTVFRPEVVLIGGGLSAQGANLIDRVVARAPRYVHAADLIGVPPIIKATLGNDAGTVGAAFQDLM